MTHIFGSTIVLERPRSFEDISQNATPQTQSGGDGGGTNVPFAPSIPGPDDDEPQAVALAAEAFLVRQRIASLLNVTDQWNVIHPSISLSLLREQRGYATLGFLAEEGGASWEI